jgi:hypothetical protein
VCAPFSEFLKEDLLWKDLYERTWPEEFKVAEETLRKRRREEEEKEEKEKERKEKEEREKEKGKDNDNEKEAEAGTKESADKEGSSSPPPAKKQKLRHSAPTSPSFSEALIEEEERALLEARLRDAQVLGLPFPPFMDVLARVSPPAPTFLPSLRGAFCAD